MVVERVPNEKQDEWVNDQVYTIRPLRILICKLVQYMNGLYEFLKVNVSLILSVW